MHNVPFVHIAQLCFPTQATVYLVSTAAMPHLLSACFGCFVSRSIVKESCGYRIKLLFIRLCPQAGETDRETQRFENVTVW